MGQLKFISREKLVEYLDEELRQSLNERGLYEINQYGWLDDGEPDPEHIGHAMWQETPPEFPKLLILGEEFTNLMRSARHSLGLTCLHHDVTGTLSNDSDYAYSVHYADTVNKLNLSSDRIREFLITAFAHRSPSNESRPVANQGNAYDTFRLPFQSILNDVSSCIEAPHSLKKHLIDILSLAEKIARKHSLNQNPVYYLTNFENRITNTAGSLSMGYPDEVIAEEQTNTCNPSNQELVEWYNTLVEISNLVFIAENSQRYLSNNSGSISNPPHKRKIM